MRKFFVLIITFILLFFGFFNIYKYFEYEIRDNNLKVQKDYIFEDLKEFNEKNNFFSNENKEKKEFKDYIFELRRKMGYENISGVISTGVGGIFEVFAVSKDDYFLNRDLNGRYNSFGTVFTYENDEDFSKKDVITFFGHHLENSDLRFTPLGKYEKYKKNLNFLDLYTTQNHYSFELAYVVVVDNFWYDKIYINDKKDLEKFWYLSYEKGIILENLKTFESDRKYVILSTCRDLDAEYNVVAIYMSLK